MHITLLVVEDEPIVRMDTADTLSEMGYRVLEAENADQAILLLQTYPEIAAVITDIDMPGTMDGRELARIVRDRWPPCRLIIVSGHQTMTANELPTDSRFLGKPVLPTMLQRTLAELGIGR